MIFGAWSCFARSKPNQYVVVIFVMIVVIAFIVIGKIHVQGVLISGLNTKNRHEPSGPHNQAREAYTYS